MFHLIILSDRNRGVINLDKPGDYLAFIHNVSGKFNFKIKERKVNLKIFGLYVGGKDERFSLEITQHHLEPLSRSTSLVKGVFNGKAAFIYQGLIRIEKKGQKTRAYQKNQNMSLSKDCFIKSKPFLEILANDVSCGHGSTTGQFNKETVFYLQTRKMRKRELRKLLIGGFTREVFDKIEKIPLSPKDGERMARWQIKVSRKLHQIIYD